MSKLLVQSYLFGYSLADIDITRILHATPEIKSNCCFVVMPNPAEDELFTLERLAP